MICQLRIPTERIAVLIGNKGETKRNIEKKTSTKISICNGEIEINSEDALAEMVAENIVRAIGRGFAPEKAMKLLDEECVLDIIELPKEEKKLRRIKSRLIGEGGKARRNLERLSGCTIAIYGRTISIIGDAESVSIARKSVEELIEGFSHATVWRHLEKWRKERRTSSLS